MQIEIVTQTPIFRVSQQSVSTQRALRALREPSESTLRALREHSKNIQRALREHSESTPRETKEQSESNQSIKIRVNTVGAFKYCVLFIRRAVSSIYT